MKSGGGQQSGSIGGAAKRRPRGGPARSGRPGRKGSLGNRSAAGFPPPGSVEVLERLREAEETIAAICSGEVDAVVVRGPRGPKVYSLSGADQPYRFYVERMQEGAVTVAPSGLVLYANVRYAEMVGVRLEQVVSSHLECAMGSEAWRRIARVLEPGIGVVKDECLLARTQGPPLPVQVTASRLPLSDQDVLCLVVTDLTEQKERSELRLGKELAEKANLAKDAFLAALSHELRTPLTPALLAATSLENAPNLPACFRSEIALVRRNIELEARLIDDLLDLTRIARGKLELHHGPMDLHTAIHRALEICRAEIGAKNQQLSVELKAEVTKTLGDAVRIQQAVWNLLRNAIKFTPPGGSISIRSANSAPGRLWLQVRDSGIGIDPEARKRLFHSFEQGGRHITRQFGGLGLGLTITRSIIEAHGGTIRAESDGPQRGASFTVELPLQFPESAASAPEHCETASASHPASRLRILLVEDHRDSRVVLERLLGRQHAVRSAESAGEALELAACESFDVVISDLGLPDMSGLDLMRQLRSTFGLKGIALSGFGMEQDIEESRAAGFAHHVTKPVRTDFLRQILESFAPRNDPPATVLSGDAG